MPTTDEVNTIIEDLRTLLTVNFDPPEAVLQNQTKTEARGAAFGFMNELREALGQVAKVHVNQLRVILNILKILPFLDQHSLTCIEKLARKKWR